MAGCYGNSAEDRYFERMLDNYLDQFDEEEEEVCPDCEGTGEIHVLYEDSKGRDMDKWIPCENCNQ